MDNMGTMFVCRFSPGFGLGTCNLMLCTCFLHACMSPSHLGWFQFDCVSTLYFPNVSVQCPETEE